MSVQLSSDEQSMLSGGHGEAVAAAMRILTRTAEAMGAARLLEISSAHIDGCLYHGQAGLDFAERLRHRGGRVVVPTTLNVGSLDLIHPEIVRPGPDTDHARRLMDAYVAMGCRPTWTCAPYQLPDRPGRGDQIAWAESNAIVFANSVLGARTERYGDFLDICAALTGRAPAVGLHLDVGRLAEVIVDATAIEDMLDDDAAYPVLGHLLGTIVDDRIPAIVGLPPGTDEDRLKAIGAAASSSGSLAMFHAVGITPEAPDLAACTTTVAERVSIGIEAMRTAARELTNAPGRPVDAVSIGTPHYSLTQMRQLVELLGDRQCRLPLWVNTGRDVLVDLGPADTARLEAAGVRIVTDTCTYITPIIDPDVDVVMTDSGKWAYYAPSNLGVDVVYASTAACVETAVTGEPADPW